METLAKLYHKSLTNIKQHAPIQCQTREAGVEVQFPCLTLVLEGVQWSAQPGHFTPRKDLVPIVQ